MDRPRSERGGMKLILWSGWPGAGLLFSTWTTSGAWEQRDEYYDALPQENRSLPVPKDLTIRQQLEHAAPG